MKILALHGLGSSGAMFKQQLAPFMKGLGNDYQFTFFDGAISCIRGPGVPDWVPGPFLSYAAGFTPHEMREALSQLEEFVQQHGPFDGVFGFSLGASLAISQILDRQRKQEPAPYAFAVFFSTQFVASPVDSYCEEPLQRWLSDDYGLFRSVFPDGDFMPLLANPTERTLAEYFKTYLEQRSTIGTEIMPSAAGDLLGSGQMERVPRLVHPDLLPDRVKIPTVHIAGVNDSSSIQIQSQVAQNLCLSSIRRVHEHDGGHSVPHTTSDVREIFASIVEMAKEDQEMRDMFDI